MNREHQPCGACSKFVPAKAGSGDCTGFDRPAAESDRPCVLFTEQGTWATRKAQQPPEPKKHRTTETA